MAKCSSLQADHKVRQVWDFNLESEYLAFVTALDSVGPSAIMALDTEFTGVLDETLWNVSYPIQYTNIPTSVALFRPIQLGLALASHDGRRVGAWNFNLHFDAHENLHTDASLNFLRDAGVKFEKHFLHGISPKVLGRLLASTFMVAKDSLMCITFSGLYDLAYLVNLVSADPLPDGYHSFQRLLSVYCPKHRDLREQFPFGSLDVLAQQHGMKRHGPAHNAGSDAQLTLDLFLCTRRTSFEGPEQVKPRSTEEGWKDPHGWGAAARFAMLSGQTTAPRTAPAVLWGAFAREAVTSSRSSLVHRPTLAC